jgi:phosphoenolpyruvate carboxylase
MVLAKADMDIAGNYSHLCRQSEHGLQIHTLIRKEYERTVRQVLDITGSDMLLQEDPPLALSITRRNPYLDPLNHIQVLLLKRLQDNENQPPNQQVWLAILLRSINAIAAGLRNTG